MDHLGRDSDEDQDGLLAAGVDLINEIAATSKLDSVWNKRTLSALTSTGTADFYILLSTLTVHLKKERYKRTKQTQVNMRSTIGRNIILVQWKITTRPIRPNQALSFHH